MSEESKPIIRKDDLVTLLANRANFYKKDIYKIVNALSEILAEAIESGQEIRVKGLFNLTYQKVKPERFHNVLTGQWEEGSEYTRCILRLARQLRDCAIEDPTKRKIYQTRQAELRRAGLLEDGEEMFEEDELEVEDTDAE
jgi:nucleoid DNA-binding protein